MSWANVKLIFLRELRDQLRDRRTLFTIAVLPLLLYPLMGMSMLQMAQFQRDHSGKVWVIGAAGLPEDPLLLEDGKFASSVCGEKDTELIELGVSDTSPVPIDELHSFAEKSIQKGDFDVVVYFPPDFAAELANFRHQLNERGEQDETTVPVKIPEPTIFSDTANDRSKIAFGRVSPILQRWRQLIIQDSLHESDIPASATAPFEVVVADVAQENTKRAAFWSKVLPFVVLIWALTGAFYPAIDLCAGEKERGTLETLLSSPAGRNEIVWGKLLTIMSFSMATSLLNMVSMGFTGVFIFRQMAAAGGTFNMGPPPLVAMGWLVLALIPISALFSALSLAIAAFARSSKEGQYYLMPLLLISMPLMVLPMLPGAELDLGTSLIPISGVMLLLRALMEGQFREALPFIPAVVSVTALCCTLAIRWAISQFQNESILFRESERWGLGSWFRHLVRGRGDTPTFGEAMLCGLLLLMIRFFAGFSSGMPSGWNGFAIATLVTLIALIAIPAVLMTIMLTRSPKKTLNLGVPLPWALPAAAMLAMFCHPAAMVLTQTIHQIYPLSSDVSQQLGAINSIIADAPGFWAILLVMAVAPAICEELAFRGFILSGLRHMGHKWAAIIISSLFFGATHGLLQQSLAACVVGVVIGYLVVQSGSLWTGVIFHLVYNSLSLTLSLRGDAILESQPWMSVLIRAEGGYQWYAIIIGGFLSAAMLWWFRSLPYQATAEERLQEALDHESTSTEPALSLR